MENICFKILEQWAKFTNFDPNQTKFHFYIGSVLSEYDVNKITKKVAHITDKYDETGMLAVLVIKSYFMRQMKDYRIRLLDLLKNPKEYDDTINMYQAFHAKEVIEAETRYADNLYKLASKISGIPMIEQKYDETEEEEIYPTGSQLILNITEQVIDAMDKLKLECYQKGGTIGTISKVSTSIHIFPDLRNCVLTLSNADDGMYLCYIDVAHSADGYFGFFIKSNGNLFSLNERIEEAYKGSHQHSRNGRWTENKLDTLFPYDFIFNYDNYDYKGYSTTYMIDEDKLSFFNLEERVYMPILLAMIFTIKQYSGKVIEQNPVYIDSLFKVNINTLTDNKNELMVVNQNQIVQYNQSLDISFDEKSVLDSSAYETVKNVMTANNSNQILIDLYGQNFKIQPTVLSTQKSLTDGSYEYLPEFVGTAEQMRAQAYYDIRRQLASHIREEMHKEYDNFGGYKAVQNWFIHQVRGSISKLEKMIKEKHLKVQEGKDKFIQYGWSSSDDNITFDITIRENESSPVGVLISYIYNQETAPYSWDFYDERCHTKCSIWFIFQPKNYIGLEKIFGTEVPKIIKGWKHDGHRTYGNSILDMTDPVESVGTPFERAEYEAYSGIRNVEDFRFAIGYSKRGFARMLKEV